MNYQLLGFWIIILAIMGLLAWATWLLIKKFDLLGLLGHADAYGVIKLKNGDTILREGRRTKELDKSNKFVTSNYLHFKGVSGAYLALPGTHDSVHKNVPCFLFVEGDQIPKRILSDGSIKNAVSAELANIAVRIELLAQCARELQGEFKIPTWVFIVGGAVLLVIIIGIVIYVRSHPAAVAAQVVQRAATV